ncbi:MAG: Zn-ribbon domain-containing OB-fold protein [Candidatus Binatia bacterium]
MSEYIKPLPVPSLESTPFWDGCKEHHLLLPRCHRCGSHWFPAAATCPKCLSTEWEWARSSGRGKIYSYGVYHRVYHQGFQADIPYVLAVVQLDEGPRLVSNIVGCAPEELKCDMPVEVFFEDVTEDTTLYKFRLLR